MLTGPAPVIVLIEPIQQLTGIDTISDVVPYLWHSPRETLWDPYAWNQTTHPWDGVDRDGNTYPDDAYGWNFADPNNQSPNFIGTDELAAHGRFVSKAVVDILNQVAVSQTVRVKIMYVVTLGTNPNSLNAGTDALNYILAKKQATGIDAVNIVAVGAFTSRTDRAGAQALNDAGIMLIGGGSNDNTDYDSFPGNTSSAFYNATPRSGVQQAALDNVIPVTTSPSYPVTGHGVNSFFGAADGHAEHSFAGPAAAAMAALSVQAYQDLNDGENPSIQRIKQAMMSGVDYVSGLNNLTVTHDYDSTTGRKDGGVFKVANVMAAINASTEISGVSMSSPTPVNSLETKFNFALNSSVTPSNWTISWGDNSGSVQSGVEVRPGLQTSIEHTFPFENIPHHYFPTIYAMSASRRVYLQAPSAQLNIHNDKWAPTGAQDNYTLAVSGSNVVLTLQNTSGTTSASFLPGDVPKALFTLGAGTTGGDTLTIDFTNGNPLQSMSLNVTGTPGANNVVRIIGAANNTTSETFDVAGGLVTTHGSTFLNQNVLLYIDGRNGNDTLTLVGGKHAGPTVHLDSNQAFTNISIDKFCTLIVDQNGTRVLQTKALSIDTNTASLDLNDNDLIVDYTGASVAAAIQGLINSARNGGNWDGTSGITSTSAKGASPKNTTLGVLEASEYQAIYGSNATFDNQTIDTTAVLVKFTYYGDTDFGGTVNFDDYSRTDAGFNNNRSGWLNGDFDGNGSVNFDDYALIDLAFNTQGGSLFSFGPGEGDPNLIALGQMEHFTESYMWFFIDWNIQNRGVYYTPEDFFPDGVPW